MTSANPPPFDPSAWQPPAPEEIQAMLPQYEVTELIGRGGMGAVYRGRQVNLDRFVAIKILPAGMDEIDATFSERFRNEALAMAKLNHPGLVAVYNFGKTSNGMLYIVMELVDGTDVAHMLAQQGRLPAAHAMAITAHVCDALKYAHDRGIIHRDIKPANIMVGYDGAVKVADFGLARMDQGDQSGLTQSGMAMGTMHYIAPEALTLGVSVDQRADIYALGVMLYHMLTGKLPHGVFKLPSLQVEGLDSRYDGIISRALHYDRELRYQSVEELRHDLDSILTGPVARVEENAAKAPATLNTTARPQRPADTPNRPPQRQAPPQQKSNLGFWVPVIGVVLAMGAAYVWLANPERKKIQRIEGEAMKVVQVTGGRVNAQDTAGFRSSVWSGDSHLWWHDGNLEDTLTLALPVAESGRQRVKGVLTGAGDYAIVAVSLDGQQVPGSPFDMEAGAIGVSDILDWGVYNLKKGEHTVEIKLVGNHGRSGSRAAPFCFGMDYVQLEPPTVKTAPAAPGTDVASKARPCASFCFSGDSVKAMNASREDAPMRSDDAKLARQTWVPHRSSLEWAQYEWDRPQVLNECQVFWYDDRTLPQGAVRLPAFWRLLYREASGAWVPVEAAIPQAERDTWNIVKFPAVRTTGLRIVAQCQLGWSAGICGWKALAADPASVADPVQKSHPDLFLGDLPPLHAQVGWFAYRVNHYNEIENREGKKLLLGGKECSQYLLAHPISRIEFAIPAGYTRFTATGFGPTSIQKSWKYSVLVDDQSIFESNELITYPGQEAPIDITFPLGSKKITLITDPCGNGNSDHAFWGYPTLHAPNAASAAAPTTEQKAVMPASHVPPPVPVAQNPASAFPSAPVLTPPPPGYVRVETYPMFTGTSLAGWKGLDQFWSVQDGAITMKCTADNHPTRFTSLIWKGLVEDFEFSCKFKISGGDGKSWRSGGIQFRTRQTDRDYCMVAGYSAEMDFDHRYTGALGEKLGRELPTKRGQVITLQDSGDARKPKGAVSDSFATDDEISKRIKRDDWNDYKIIAAGKRIQLFVNGQLTMDVTDETKEAARSGLLALSNFYNSVMTLQFKDLWFTVLKESANNKLLTFGGHRYQYVEQNLTWRAAREKSEQMGGHLATISNAAENEWIIQSLRHHLIKPRASILLGGVRSGAKDHWSWITNEPFAFTNWHEGKPDSKEDYVVLCLWRSDANDQKIDWKDRGMNLDPDTLGFLVEWDDDGSGTPAAKLKIHSFAQRIPAALDNVFTTRDIPDSSLRPSLAAMRDELVTEGRAQPPASLDAYRSAHTLCGAMLSALDERETSSSPTAWATRAQALRPVLEDLHTKVRNLLPTVR